MSTITAPAGLAVSEATAETAAATVCPSCAGALLGKYCHQCGERRPAADDFALRRFFRDVGREVADVDSKALRTVRYLLFRPGFLTTEYLAGRRQLYVGPLKLYLVTFALLLFVTTFIPSSRSPQAQDGFVATGVQALVDVIAAERGIAAEAARTALEDTVTKHMSWLSVLVPLTFGAFAYAMFFRRRRWFGENLVFATHFATFNYLVGILLLPVQMAAGESTLAVGFLAFVVMVPMLWWMYLAVRRVYATSWWGGLAAAFALMIALSICQLITGAIALGTSTAALIWL